MGWEKGRIGRGGAIAEGVRGRGVGSIIIP